MDMKMIGQMPALIAELLEGQRLMLRLLAAALPSSPALTTEVAVATRSTRLAVNNSADLMRIVVTNDDPAQPIWLGGRDVLITNGEVLVPQASVPFNLAKGKDIWAVCAAGTVSARITQLHDPLALLIQQG